MTESRPGPIRRFIVGLWDAINFTRRLVFNAIFLFVVIVVLAAIAASPGARVLEDKTALVLSLDGMLVEQYSSSPMERAIARATGEDSHEIQLRDLLEAIAKARDDKRIERIVLLTDGFSVSGFAAMRDLAGALRDFRAAGKQVVAFGAGMEQKGYYLAAQADEVYLDPQGAVLLEGLGRYRMYYRTGLQDKLGVDVHLFRVGEFKSAAEPYILDAPSPESREADLYWMNDLWGRFLSDLAVARKLDRAELDALVANLPARVQAAGGDLAQLALDAKLVDGLMTSQEFEELLAKRGAVDEEEHSFRQIELEGYLAHVRREALDLGTGPRVAVVVAQGEIVDGDQPPGTVGGDSTSALLRDAREDDDVKAVVLRVDSPGGGAFASELINREVELTRAAGKPVVVSMGNVAASGGYWISMNADHIYADESTITGSIGIYGLWLSMPRVLEKIGVRTDGVGTTPLAGAFDPTRALDPQVGVLVQAVIDKGYSDFTGKVAAARGTTPEAIDLVARGRVWSGAQAKERGLVDELGGLQTALAKAAALAKLKPGGYRVAYVEKPLTAFEKAFADMGHGSRLDGLLRLLAPTTLGLDRATSERLQGELRWLDRHGRTPLRAVAHCLCGL